MSLAGSPVAVQNFKSVQLSYGIYLEGVTSIQDFKPSDMKTTLAAIAFIAMIMMACGPSREVNVEMVNAQLVKVDTIYRSSDNPKQQLTWRDSDNIEYISIVSMNRSYPLGVVMSMLRPR
jgi:vesicle coat complex subunit